jgi:2-C-methyl-D-erythritol 4-phosphate cytidylyltransferase
MSSQLPMKVAAILLAAGVGVRLGSTVPKAFHPVCDQTLLEHVLPRFVDHPSVRDVVVVVPPVLLDRAREITAGSGCVVIPGGVTRLDSVRAGLAVLHPDIEAVLVHDVARAFVPAEVIERVVQALLDGADAVVPALPVIDTIKTVRPSATGELVVDTLDRSMLRAIQTPQGFRRSALTDAHSRPSEVTDDARLIELAGGTVVVVPGADEAFKVTRPWDLLIAEALVASERRGQVNAEEGSE